MFKSSSSRNKGGNGSGGSSSSSNSKDPLTNPGIVSRRRLLIQGQGMTLISDMFDNFKCVPSQKVNLGNSCYLNSVLQGLGASRPLRDALAEYPGAEKALRAARGGSSRSRSSSVGSTSDSTTTDAAANVPLGTPTAETSPSLQLLNENPFPDNLPLCARARQISRVSSPFSTSSELTDFLSLFPLLSLAPTPRTLVWPSAACIPRPFWKRASGALLLLSAFSAKNGRALSRSPLNPNATLWGV